MGTTAVRTGQGRIWEVPPAILTHAPRSAAKAAADAQSAAPPTYLHPAVIAATAAGYAWMLLVFWVVFAGDGYMGFALVIATLISGMMLGLLAVGASGGREMAPWQRHWRSFREFLSGRVEIWGAQMSGRAAFVQLVGMAWCLVALAAVFGLAIAATRPKRRRPTRRPRRFRSTGSRRSSRCRRPRAPCSTAQASRRHRGR